MTNLERCPFCQSEAELVKRPLWNNGHGYPGCYDFSVRCSSDKCLVMPESKRYSTIYEKDEEKQKQKAIYAWNNRDKKGEWYD